MFKPLRKSSRNRFFMSRKKKEEIEREIFTSLKKTMKNTIKKTRKKKDENFEIKDGNKTYLVKYEGDRYDGETIYHDWEDENPVKLKEGEKIFNVYNKNEVNKHGYSERSIQDDGTGLPVKYTKKKGLMFFPNDDGGKVKRRTKRKRKRKRKRKTKRKTKRTKRKTKRKNHKK